MPRRPAGGMQQTNINVGLLSSNDGPLLWPKNYESAKIVDKVIGMQRRARRLDRDSLKRNSDSRKTHLWLYIFHVLNGR